MSKAFIKESDAGSSEDAVYDEMDTLPQGVPNYVTPKGALLLKEELERLNSKDIPDLRAVLRKHDAQDGHWEADAVTTAKHSLQRCEMRSRLLHRRLASMVIILPENQVQDRVYFGAQVKVLQDGQPKTYTIVGVDEADAVEGLISWISPLAVGLRGARVGDKRMLDLPSGLMKIEIKEIHYA